MRLLISVLILTIGCDFASAAMFVGDWGNKAGGFNDVVLQYDQEGGGFIGAFASGGGLDAPTDMKFGPDGDLYVASAGSDAILRYDGKTGAFKGLAASGGGLGFPWGFAFGPDGNIYVSSPLLGHLGPPQNSVLRYNGVTGAFMGVFASGLLNIRQLAFGSDGSLYVVDNFGRSVNRYNGSTGELMGAFVANGLADPHGIAFGPDGNLYVSDQTSNRIVRFAGTTGVLIDDFVATELANPYGLAFGPDGDLYVADYVRNAVLRFDGTSGFFRGEFVSSSTVTVVSPHAVAFTPVVRDVPAPNLVYLIGLVVGVIFAGRMRRAGLRLIRGITA
jgi:DNA-binding beta-propeller fold protein YncE